VLDEDEIVPGAADPNNSAGPVGSEQPQPGQSQSDNGQGEGIENATVRFDNLTVPCQTEVYPRQELATPGNQEDSGAAETKLPHQDSIPESIPQAILGTGMRPGQVTSRPAQENNVLGKKQTDILVVQDEKLKNLLMSWYYAGYYTGLYTGQQPGSNSGGPAE